MSLTPSTDRIHIALLGRMNAGKSTLLNLLTQSNTSIADATPGTTADAKVAFMQLHGVGPARLFDCAGMDETGALGAKKLQKTLNIARRSDVVLHVLDAQLARGGAISALVVGDYAARLRGERPVAVESMVRDVCGSKVLTVLNCRGGVSAHESYNQSCTTLKSSDSESTDAKSKQKASFSPGMYERAFYGPLLAVDLHKASSRELTRFISQSAPGRAFGFLGRDALIPRCVTRGQRVLLVSPLDEEAPKQHLLRPQAMALEAFLAHRNVVEIINPDVARLRAGDADELARLKTSVRAADFILADSQLVDVVSSCALPAQRFSTFSIQQCKYLTGKHFQYLVDSLRDFQRAADSFRSFGIEKAAQGARKGPRVLIAEACTHDRLTDICEDIGTRQIPRLVREKLGGDVIFSFGKDDEVIERENVDLAVHCGGCMISKQQMQQRIAALRSRGIPCTNYGMFIAWARGGSAARAIEPWK